MSNTSILWHDYETWGVNPRVDQPSQFAAIRTDEDLNIIDRPIEIFCKPTYDRLPHPRAAMVTGISPLSAEQQGFDEPEFIRKVNDAFSVPGTCGAGYNSIRFDDEVTRHTLFRNFFDPYQREYSNGNSRWDLINALRMAHALRPEGINWPEREDGFTSFKLEDLTAANHIDHAGAHDALVDVKATIEMARKLREAQPKFFNYLFDLRKKDKARAVIEPNRGQPTPFLHTSAMLGPERLYTAPMILLGWNKDNANAAICLQLDCDNEWILTASADDIREVMFTPKASRSEHQKDIGLKQIQINRCPALAPISLLKDQAIINRTGLSLEKIQHRAANWLTPELAEKLCQVFTPRDYPEPDVEASLYSGFASYNDKNLMVEVRDATIEKLTHQSFHFEDPRYNALLFRYKARFFPQTLTHQEQLEWRELLRERLIDGGTEFLTVQGFDQQITEIQNELANTPNKKAFALLNDLVLFRTKLIG